MCNQLTTDCGLLLYAISIHGWLPIKTCRFNGRNRFVFLFLRERDETQVKHKAKLKDLHMLIINGKAKKRILVTNDF